MDAQIIGLFKKWQDKEGKYPDLDIEKVEFEYKQLGELIEIFDNKRIPLSESQRRKKQGQYPYYGASGVIDYVDEYIFDGEYLLISEDGENLRRRVTPIAFWAKGKFWVNNHAHIVLGKKDLLYTDYLRLYVLSNKLYGFISETSQPKLSQKNLKKIPILLPLDFINFNSYQIQKAIVEFLDYRLGLTQAILKQIKPIREKVELLDKIMLPKVFEMKDPYLREQFDKWAKRKGCDISADEIAFEIKRIISDNPGDTVCKKRMGFTPKKDPNGNINWFTVADLNNVQTLTIDNPDTKDKTTMELVRKAVDPRGTGRSEKLEPIKKGDILVSFKLSVGVTKIYNSSESAYCNEAIDILSCKEGYYNKYIAYNCIVEYPKYGTKTNNGITLNDDEKKKIKIFIPRNTGKYTSQQIQYYLVEFIEAIYAWSNDIKSRIDKISKNLDLLDEVTLALTFRK